MDEYNDLNNQLESIQELEERAKKIEANDTTFSIRNQSVFFVTGFGYLGLLLISFIGGLIAALFTGQSDAWKNLFLNGFTYGVLFIIFLVFCFLEKDKFFAKMKKWKSLFIGLGLGVALILVEVLLSMLIGIFYKGDQGLNQQAANDLFKTYPTISFFVMCLIGPFCEEITFRCGLYDLLKRKNKILAIIIEVLAFVIIHIKFTDTTLAAELSGLPIYILIGLGLTLIYDKFDLPASFMAHFALNFASMITVLLR